MRRDSRPFALGVVILAAGKSSRMGRPKLLLPWETTTVLGQVVEVWNQLGARQTAIVCDENDSALAQEMDRLQFPPSDRIYNAAPERGMFSSIQCAAAWDGWGETLTHWAVVLGDQPHLRPETLRGLLAFGRGHPEQICQPSSAGRPRHPVLLPRQVFAELAGCSCSKLSEFLGARPVAFWAARDPGLDLDLDTPEDYQRALEMARR
jgi:molybdenum cofactor cytidylyltransferase